MWHSWRALHYTRWPVYSCLADSSCITAALTAHFNDVLYFFISLSTLLPLPYCHVYRFSSLLAPHMCLITSPLLPFSRLFSICFLYSSFHPSDPSSFFLHSHHIWLFGTTFYNFIMYLTTLLMHYTVIRKHYMTMYVMYYNYVFWRNIALVECKCWSFNLLINLHYNAVIIIKLL